MASHHDHMYDEEIFLQQKLLKERAASNNRTYEQQFVHEQEQELFMKGRDLYYKKLEENKLIRYYREHVTGKFADVKLADGNTVAEEFQKMINQKL
jgi:hypothetical protein